MTSVCITCSLRREIESSVCRKPGMEIENRNGDGTTALPELKINEFSCDVVDQTNGY